MSKIEGVIKAALDLASDIDLGLVGGSPGPRATGRPIRDLVGVLQMQGPHEWCIEAMKAGPPWAGITPCAPCRVSFELGQKWAGYA